MEMRKPRYRLTIDELIMKCSDADNFASIHGLLKSAEELRARIARGERPSDSRGEQVMGIFVQNAVASLRRRVQRRLS